MKYADFVKKEFGEEYVFEIGDYAITTEDICLIPKGTKVRIVGVSARGYDLMDEHGIRVIETSWNRIRKL